MATRAWKGLLVAVLVGLPTVVSAGAGASAGAPFGSCGVVPLPWVDTHGGLQPEGISALAAAPGGRVVSVVAGSQLVRLLPDGTPDPDFGTQGRVATGGVGALAVQADGRIIIAAGTGGADPRLVLTRYALDGTVDTSFGTAGSTSMSVRWVSSTDLLLAADGSIVAGASTGSGSVVTRMDADGRVDRAFGQNGVAEVPGVIESIDLAVQPDGGVVVAGMAGRPDGDFGLGRLTATGTLDTTFGVDGIPPAPLAHVKNVVDVAVDDRGRVLTIGWTLGDGYSFDFVARHTPSGQVDATFGDGGVVAYQNGLSVSKIVPLQAGSFVVAGAVGLAVDRMRLGVTRHDDRGRADPSFGALEAQGATFPAVGPLGTVSPGHDGGWLFVGAGTTDIPSVVARAGPDGASLPGDIGAGCVRGATISPAVRPQLHAALGATTPPQTVTLTNSGVAPLNVGAVAVMTVGDGPSGFRVVEEGCSRRTLAANASCAVSLAYAPTTGGNHNVRLVIPHSLGYSQAEFVGVVDPRPARDLYPDLPYSSWTQPQGPSIDGLGTWIAPVNAPTAQTGQLPVTYFYGHFFGFDAHPGAGAVGLLASPAGESAVLTVVEADGTPHAAAVPFDFRPNRLYFPLVHRVGPGQWAAWVYDHQAATWTPIGVLHLPPSWGGLNANSLTALVWQGAHAATCGAYPEAEALFHPSIAYRGGGSTVATLRAVGKVSADCPAVAVTAHGVWSHYRLGTPA